MNMKIRSVADIEAQRTLLAKRQEVFVRLQKGSLSQQERKLEEELLFSITQDLMALEERNKPPPPERVFPEALKMSREQRAAKAAEIRMDPRFFRGPGVPHPDGIHGSLTKQEHETLVQIAAELSELDVDPGVA